MFLAHSDAHLILWLCPSKYYFCKRWSKVTNCSLPDGSPQFLSPPSVMWCENRVSSASLRYPSLCYRLPSEPDCFQVSWSVGLLVCVRGNIIQTWLKRHTFPLLLSPQWDPVWARFWITWSNFSCTAISDVLQRVKAEGGDDHATSTFTSSSWGNVQEYWLDMSDFLPHWQFQPRHLKLVYNRAEISSTVRVICVFRPLTFLTFSYVVALKYCRNVPLALVFRAFGSSHRIQSHLDMGCQWTTHF